MRELGIRSGQAFVVVYAVNSRASFEEALQLVTLVLTLKRESSWDISPLNINDFTTAFAVLHLVTLTIKDGSLHGSDHFVYTFTRELIVSQPPSQFCIWSH